ncbi:MAG: hypothetical protein Q8L14_35700 [Myxococcales bacterium]|nr:hypothetical protein [Myxococcales bacterium]
MTFKTEQESFWAGEFGDAYAERNKSDVLLAANLAFFSRIIARTGRLDSLTEFGANVGMNLKALRLLLPTARIAAVEINPSACAELRKLEGVQVFEGSLLGQVPPVSDLAFFKGVLIHINPDELKTAYAKLDATAGRFALIAEYYNPTPMTVPYRGHAERLFKRDFAGEFQELHKGWKLIDYGFLYRRDPVFPQDDISWFLMERA